jgi:phosphate:Na+ symporter
MNWMTFWECLAGLGIFLFGFHLLENSLRKLVGRTFKLFLKKHTGSKLKAIFSGTFITAMLQSSSVVSLMVLAFVGAGTMNMRSGLAVVFGANLGTTLSSWMVALVGFEFNIEKFALPIIAIAGIGLALLKKERIRQFCMFAIGFGFLFLGLHFMKTSMVILLDGFDFSPYAGYNRVFFILLGLGFTAMIQSSSATMIIVMSALYTGTIPFTTAVAIVIGSELGTTLNIIIGSMGGSADKKRIALGNVIFNISITFLAAVFMIPLINVAIYMTGESEQLIALVLFQTIINFAGLLLFFPFLSRFGNFLDSKFKNGNENVTEFIHKTGTEMPDFALESLEKEVRLLLNRVVLLNQDAFQINEKLFSYHPSLLEERKILDTFKTYTENYDMIKESEGEILLFYSNLRKEKMEELESKRLDQLILSVRNALHSAKALKDIRHNREEFRSSEEDEKYLQYKNFRSQLASCYLSLNRIKEQQNQSVCFEELLLLMEKSVFDQEKNMRHVFENAGKKKLSENEISSLLNLNQAVYSSTNSLIHSFKFLLLDENRVQDFDSVPRHRMKLK